MVQEFHVLRCFSCQTFQVQQVKKSKSWLCKVCGEKQSLIKEFGRGAAVDCRRHVQKLNALQGRVQEISYELLESQWDQDEEEDVHEGLDEDQLNESQQEVPHHVSRWSKYTDPTDEEQDEDEEDNVYTERQRFRSQATRKRKKLSGVNSCADGDEDARCGIKRPCQRFGSGSVSGAVDPCRSSDLPSSRPAACRVPGASEESSGNRPQSDSSHRLTAVSPALSSRQPSEETKSERDSKWDKFLPVVPTQQDEQEFDYQADALSSPRFEPSGLGNAVGEQPPPAKPALSFNPLFLTDEDFDDTF